MKDLFHILCFILIMQISVHYTIKIFKYTFDKHPYIYIYFFLDFVCFFERVRAQVGRRAKGGAKGSRW